MFKVYLASYPVSESRTQGIPFVVKLIGPKDITLFFVVIVETTKPESFAKINRLLKESFKTLKPGKRKLDLKVDPSIRLNAGYQDKKVSLRILESYEQSGAKTDEGWEYKFQIAPLSSSSPTLGLMLFISSHAQTPDFSESGKKVKSILFGTKQIWLEQKKTVGGKIFWSRETIYPPNPQTAGNTGSYLHIKAIVEASDKQELNKRIKQMKKIIRSMELID